MGGLMAEFTTYSTYGNKMTAVDVLMDITGDQDRGACEAAAKVLEEAQRKSRYLAREDRYDAAYEALKAALVERDRYLAEKAVA
jgi:hypothetical protein